jgi:predicted nucleic acid-binding protein
MIAVVDADPLYAATDTDGQDHTRSRAVLERSDLQLVIPALVVAEVTSIVGRRLGPDVEARFLRGLASFDIEGPAPEDWPRIADLVEQYRAFPLAGTDASVVALAERLDATLVITLDHRHFAAVKPRHHSAFELLPG